MLSMLISAPRFGRLAHPVILAAALALFFNATVAQPYFPSWWTGKLGDVAWLTFVPVMVAEMLAYAWPARFARWRPAAALAGVGLFFTLVKTVPVLNGLVLAAFGWFGLRVKLALDPTDLLALPGLAVAAWVLNQPAPRLPRQWWRWPALGLALAAMVADSPPPLNRGVVCVNQVESHLYAVTEQISYGEMSSSTNRRLYRSDDGGLTWVADTTYSHSSGFLIFPGKDDATPAAAGQCQNGPWPIADPGVEGRQIDIVGGTRFYRSDDGGKTLTLEYTADDAVTGALVDTTHKVIIAAAGKAGVLVRGQDGNWTAVDVVAVALTATPAPTLGSPR